MRRLCMCASGAMGTSPLTVRIDLDNRWPSAAARPAADSWCMRAHLAGWSMEPRPSRHNGCRLGQPGGILAGRADRWRYRQRCGAGEAARPGFWPRPARLWPR